MGIFTGDFVFVGSTGRPDLLEEAAGQAGTAEPGARELYRSIQKFLQLPGHLQVWPSHGAGSACGKGLGAIPSSTVGYEAMFNEALQFESEDAFVDYILADQPEAPPYFAVMKHVNKHGPNVIGDRGLPPKLDTQKLALRVEVAMVVDLTSPKNFGKAHVPGTVNISPGAVARDAGWFVDHHRPLYLIAGKEILEQTLRTFREMGIDDIQGYFDVEEVHNARLATEMFPFQTPDQLADQIQNGEVHLVDVRRQTEWDEGHIEQANYSFLGKLMQQASDLPTDKPIVFQCRSGARSAAACAVAQAKGIKDVINLDGGIIRWQEEGRPIVGEPQAIGRSPIFKRNQIATSSG